MPKLTVAIPTYDRKDYLEEAVRSTLAQSYGDFELLVVLDNPARQDIVDHLEMLGDKRLKILVNSRTIGLFPNFNRCVDLATGDYLYIMHDDDLMEPDNLARKVEFLDAFPRAAFVHSAYSLIDGSGRITQSGIHLADPFDTIIPGDVFIRKSFLTLNTVCCPSVMMRRDAAQRAGLWDVSIEWTADWEYWLRLAAQGDVGYLAASLFRYRVHETNESRKFDAPSRAIAAYINCKRSAFSKLCSSTAGLGELLGVAHALHGREALEHGLNSLASGDRAEAGACARLAVALLPEARVLLEANGLAGMLVEPGPDLASLGLGSNPLETAISAAPQRDLSMPVLVWVGDDESHAVATVERLELQSVPPTAVYLAGPGAPGLSHLQSQLVRITSSEDRVWSMLHACLETGAKDFAFLDAGALPGADWLAGVKAAFGSPEVGVVWGPVTETSIPARERIRSIEGSAQDKVASGSFALRRTVVEAACRTTDLGGAGAFLKAAASCGLKSILLPQAAVAWQGGVASASNDPLGLGPLVVCAPDWQGQAWTEVVKAFLTSDLGSRKPLLVLLSPASETGGNGARVVAALRTAGIDAESCPDIMLQSVSNEPGELKAWALRAQQVLTTGSELEAKLVGAQAMPPKKTLDTRDQLNWLARYVPLEAILNESGRNSLLEVGSGHRGAGCVVASAFVGIDIAFSQAPIAPMVGIAYDGNRLPFKSAAFHTVLSMDALEHVPPDKRSAFIRELLRASADRVILGFPADSEGRKGDRYMQELFRRLSLGQPDWLFEHDEHGLPESLQVEGLFDSIPEWQWRELPTPGSLACLLISFADILPGADQWVKEAIRDDAEGFRRWLGAASFGPRSRRVYLLERREPLAPSIDLDDRTTLVSALICPTCHGDFQATREQALECTACRARFCNDERQVLVLKSMAQVSPDVTFLLEPDWLGSTAWVGAIHNFLTAFEGNDPCRLWLRVNPALLTLDEAVSLLQPILAEFGERPIPEVYLSNDETEALPAGPIVTLPSSTDELRDWSPTTYIHVFRDRLFERRAA